MPIKKTIDNYKQQANIKHNNKYDYSQITELNTTHMKVKIICPKHGIFEQSFSKHLSGDGCKNCGIEKNANQRIKKANDKFIKEACELHDNKYDYSKSKYMSAKENIIIISPIHGDFEQTPNTHLGGAGCKKCSNDKTKERMSIPWNIYEEDLHKIHENKYDYSKVIWKGVDINIIVVCPIHGDFEIRPADHKTKKRGCQKCYKETHIQYNKLDTDKFVETSIQIWGKEYDYSKTKYIGADVKLIIICNKHGEFEQIPSNHYKYGCASCGREKNVRNNELKEKCKKDFEIKSNIVHNNLYNYTKSDYINAATKIIVICNEHGEFYVSPNNHLRGKGCPNCKPSYSKKQIEWLNLISKLNNIHIQHAINENEFIIPNTKYKADGFCKETNTIYEFHGDLWHGNPKIYNPDDISYFGIKYGELYEKTLKREQLIKDLGYNLVIMWEYDWDKINKSIKILQKKFRNSKLH